jgi:hypothetical protein
MYCVKCGQQLPDDANFCLKCGVAQKAGVTPPTGERELCRVETKNYGTVVVSNTRTYVLGQDGNKYMDVLHRHVAGVRWGQAGGTWLGGPSYGFIIFTLTVPRSWEQFNGCDYRFDTAEQAATIGKLITELRGAV